MNSRFARLRLALVAANLAFSFSLRAAAVSATIQTPPPAESGYFKLGTTKNPTGREISVNSRSLLFDGQRVFPVMGEFHYARVPENEWRAELHKLKAGGVDIVSTYVFWIHHEELQGQWDWSGQRDLKEFVRTCGELGLKVIVRCGPWCHGEVRNGGFPDWVQAHKDWTLRSTDTNFLAATKILYAQIAGQLHGELWKDGGPVIGIQVDNEFGGSPDYLMALKRLALEAGLDVPLYIKTGWPAMKTPVPPGELLPLFGAYPDGFWERSLQPMDGSSWENFVFKHTRTDTGVGNDTLGNRKSGDTAGTEKYPYLTCEIGGGMPASYHRRIRYDPRDVEAVAFCQLGSGSSLLGYYMYHGGQNPEGKLSTMQESQATGYANDLPVKSYDFNAPLGEFGQINPHYHWLRRLHLFLHDFGAPLAQMPVTLPGLRPTNKNDLATLRWAVRSDGSRGYVFVNNYQRLQPLPAKTNVQFNLHLPGGEFVFPAKPVTIPADEFFFWPFNLDLGGVNLVYATAQPICKIDDGAVHTLFFAETPGVKAEFAFDTNTVVMTWLGKIAHEGGLTLVHDVNPDKHIYAARISPTLATNEVWEIVLLNEADSLALWKADSKIFLTRASLSADGDKLKLASDNLANLQVEAFPVRPRTSIKPNGLFHGIDVPKPGAIPVKAKAELIKPAGPLRQIPFSTGKSHIAIAPTDAEFANAAVWKITLPPNLDMQLDPLLRIHYVGDVARLTLNGKLLDDNFYCGREFDLSLRRFGFLGGDLRLEILPLRKHAPIYLEPAAVPDFGNAESIAKLTGVEIVNRYQAGFASAGP